MEQLADSPSQHQPRPIPYGLVSLWDMINFSVASYIIHLNTLAILKRQVGDYKPRNALVAVEDDRWKQISRDVTSLLVATKKFCEPLKSHILTDQIQSLGWVIDYGGAFSRDEIETKLGTLQDTIVSELRQHFFYHYPRDKALLLKAAPESWAATIAAFPSAEEDIMAAVDCYALGHSNASIYHSMMVLEFGLPALALKLKAPVKKARPTWRDITDDIRAKIDQRRVALANTPKGKKPPSRPASKKEHKFLEHCGEAALDFKFFEHAWRNHVAHGRGDYDENDAKKVLEHVRTFMEVITGKLKLKERR